MRDDRVDAGLNATLDKGFVMFKILFAIFVPGLTTSGVEVIIKLDRSASGTANPAQKQQLKIISTTTPYDFNTSNYK
jgi:hypothetical protein